jgi:hypothetical protein
MQENTNVLFEAALGLPEEERFSLVSRLLETMPTEDLGLSLEDEDLIDELDRRFADAEGEIPWSELRAEG